MKEDNSQSDRRYEGPAEPGGEAADHVGCLLDDCTNVVYGAIIGHLQSLETGKRYLGNSHHLAQLLTRMVCDALSERARTVKRLAGGTGSEAASE